MGTWNSRGLRGSFLEELINLTIEQYRTKKLALIQKVPTPITPIKIDKESKQITLAYFEQKSTVDYIGVVQSVPVCFDAKECAKSSFPLANIHEHQYEFMKDFEAQDGVAFLIIYFKNKDTYMYLPFEKLKYFWERMSGGGPKHFSFEELDEKYTISTYSGTFLHFLEQLQTDLSDRS
ncbi:MAG: Holliday junction resolvase RecU [Eubacterium sp.]|nr:Holliday junction resolvase RecU [Eubacterium sp.]